jgi:hypothetical protein
MIKTMTVGVIILIAASSFHQVCLGQNQALRDSCSGPIANERTDTLSINKALPPFRFHTIIRSYCCTVDIVSLDGKDTLQHISEETSDLFPPSDGVRFVDANFDGYLDIMIFFNRGNTTNEDFEFWLFNPKLRRFELNQEFTDTFGCNASIDEENHEIITGGVLGCIGMCYEFETYRLMEGKITLVERESQKLADTPSDTSQFTFLRTLEKLQSGQMKIVKRVQGTLEQIDKLWRQ